MESTFLREEEIWGDSALEVMKDYGTTTGVSDLVIILGGLVCGSRSPYETIEGDKASFVWSASSDGNGDVRIVRRDGSRDFNYPFIRVVAARPALPSSVTSLIRPNEVRTLNLKNGKKVQICTYGEYPQTVVNDKISENLEKLYNNSTLKQSGKKYTFDSQKLDASSEGFKPRVCQEYELDGKNISE